MKKKPDIEVVKLEVGSAVEETAKPVAVKQVKKAKAVKTKAPKRKAVTVEDDEPLPMVEQSEPESPSTTGKGGRMPMARFDHE